MNWLTAKIKEKLILLSIGAGVTLATTFSTLFYGQFMLKADYDKDEITRLKLLTVFEQSFLRVEDKLENLDKKIDRVERKLERMEK